MTVGGMTGTYKYYLENVSIKVPVTGNGSKVSEYGVTNNTFMKVANVFDDIFPAVYAAANLTTPPLLRYKANTRNSAPFQRNLDFNPWAGTNIVTRHMERLATAMKNAMRSVTNVTLPVKGDASSMEVYVSVRWVWLILPLSLLHLSLVFLLATMKKTAKEGVWKTSAIATLLYGLPDDMQRKITTEANNCTPRSKSKQLKVKLHGTQGWRVSGTLFSPVPTKPRQYQPPSGWI